MRLLLLGLGLLCLAAATAQAETPVTIFAAASLKTPMDAIAAAWTRLGHPAPRVSLDSSGTLARQIEQGAPAQIFISADEKWMNYLAAHHLVVSGSRRDLLTNALVLVAPTGSARPMQLTPGFDLAAILGPHGRLAVGDTDSVPAGIYAKQALTRLGVWTFAQPRLAPAENVKAALLLVELGEAPAGVVYATDAHGDAKVGVIGTFPANSHDPITYPAALVGPHATAQARALMAFIEGERARGMFSAAGFGT